MINSKESNRGRLAGRVCLVTGGGRGLGRATALAFAKEDASAVAVASRTKAEVSAVAEEITREGVTALALKADVSDRSDVNRLFQSVERKFGRVDVLVNSAALIGPISTVAKSDTKKWLDTLRVNLMGTYFCCRRALPGMIARRWGRIINISGSGEGPYPNFSAYAASKSAVVRFTECLAAEVKEFNVFVNALAPGGIVTKMTEEIEAAGESAGAREVERMAKLKREGGVPLELPSKLAVLLASNPPKGLTGKLISAVHDDWSKWTKMDESEQGQLMYTMRRVDSRLRELLQSSHGGG